MANTKPVLSLPSPTYTVESSGHELRMSYGMFNDIMRMVGDIENMSTFLITDAGTRDLIIRRLFTDNKKSVDKFDELVDSFEIDILPSELDGILAWVADHCTHFLISTGRTMETVLTKYESQAPEDKTPSLPPSKDGSENLTT